MDVVLVLRHAVLQLDSDVVDVQSRPDRNVQLEQPMEGQVKGGADQVTTCVAVDEQVRWHVDSRVKKLETCNLEPKFVINVVQSSGRLHFAVLFVHYYRVASCQTNMDQSISGGDK